MLDHVERRRFLVDPAGEDPPPAFVRLLHVELKESTGQSLIFPWSGGFAGAKANDGIADPHGLAGPHREVADDSVALVEEADDCDTVRHGGNAGLLTRPGPGLLRTLGLLASLVRLAIASGREEKRESRARERKEAHVYSGVQGW